MNHSPGNPDPKPDRRADEMSRSIAAWFESLPRDARVVIAFSGGVDSSVVAAAAFATLGRRAIAVTASSASVARWQRDTADRVAQQIGIEHHIVQTDETSRPQYMRNDRERCFHCKQTLYQTTWDWIIRLNRSDGCTTAVLCSGTNADDLGDHRPGIHAGELASVRTPLAELGLRKPDVRRLAVELHLSNHDLPASPCLSSRIAYGTTVTPDRLAAVENAEDLVRGLGFTICRVRMLRDDKRLVASVEVPHPQIDRLKSRLTWSLRRQIEAFGFASVAIDPEGFRSGKLNDAVVDVVQIARPEGGQ